MPPSVDTTILRGDDEAPIAPLRSKTVAIIGYGNQGAAHAQNLRDSGLQVIVGQRPGSSYEQAAAAGFDVRSVSGATETADLVILGLPDEIQPEVFKAQIAPALRRGSTIGFIHGFAIHYGLITPPDHCGVVLVAPKGPGDILRARYQAGLGIPCLFAVHQDSSRADGEAIGLAWANGIGCARAGIITTTFKDETETDLFGEQTVLCGGMTALILAAFETLVDAGYPPELAYIECCHEVKQVADLIYEHGMAEMMARISNTAEFGAYQAGPRIVDDQTRAKMQQILTDIQSGDFMLDLLSDETLQENRRAIAQHPIERTGDLIRRLMNPPETPDSTNS